jgi:hypothetical protein
VEQVEEQQDAGDPKAAHGTEVEPIGPRVPIVLRYHDANEADYVDQLFQIQSLTLKFKLSISFRVKLP